MSNLTLCCSVVIFPLPRCNMISVEMVRSPCRSPDSARFPQAVCFSWCINGGVNTSQRSDGRFMLPAEFLTLIADPHYNFLCYEDSYCWISQSVHQRQTKRLNWFVFTMHPHRYLFIRSAGNEKTQLAAIGDCSLVWSIFHLWTPPRL